MGSCPDYYATVRAARYYGIPPWDLIEQHPVWVEVALLCEGAELGAQSTRQQHADTLRRFGVR